MMFGNDSQAAPPFSVSCDNLADRSWPHAWLSGLARWPAVKLDCGGLFLFLLWLPPLQKAFRQIDPMEEARQ